MPYTDYLSSGFESKAAKFSFPFCYKFESFPFEKSVKYLREESANKWCIVTGVYRQYHLTILYMRLTN